MKMPYAMKSLSCDSKRISGMSERLIVSHYENNYGGAVKRLNLIEEKLAELDYAHAPGCRPRGRPREGSMIRVVIVITAMIAMEVTAMADQVTFDADAIGSVPAGWTVAKTG